MLFVIGVRRIGNSHCILPLALMTFKQFKLDISQKVMTQQCVRKALGPLVLPAQFVAGHVLVVITYSVNGLKGNPLLR